MEIRKIMPGELRLLQDFYRGVISKMQGTEFDPGWDMEYYPDEEYLTHSIENCEAVGMFEDGKVISCMIVNHELEGDFDEGIWKVDAKWEEVLAMHTFGVAPKYQGKGVSKMMMEYIIGYAEKNGYKAIRLDVIPGNLPAEKLYKKHGFYYVGTFTEIWDDGTEEIFSVYERVI